MTVRDFSHFSFIATGIDDVEIRSEARDHWVRGTSRFAHGDFKGALGDFDRALEIHSEYAEAWNNRGATHLALGNHARALADFGRAVEINTRYAEAYNNCGFVRQAMGDQAGALADFDRAVEIHPGYAEALSNRGAVRHAMEDFEGALQDFDCALAITPDNLDTCFRRGSTRHASGDYNGAVEDYTHVLMHLPHEAAAPVYHDRGVVRISLREFAEAVADFDQAIAIDPQFCIAYISRGNARYHLRNPTGLDDFLTAFRIGRQRAAGEIIRVLTCGVREDPDGVLENCRQHVRICPDDLLAYARRGLSLLILGREGEAAEDFKQIAQRNSDPDLGHYLALLVESARRSDTIVSAIR
jgi:Tfp pilus assembly protein PilF